MSYNQTPREEKPFPSVEYTLKNMGWNLKIIADCLAKLVELQGGQVNHTRPSSQNFSNQNKENFPF